MEESGTSCELSIVMPCLNESGTIGICIDKANKFLTDNGLAGEIIVADNGSSDDSILIAAGKGARVIDVGELGYGNALHGGIIASAGKYVILGDSDDSYDFSNLMPFVGKLREGYDLVVGNRFKGEIKPGAMPPLHRYLGNPVLSGIGKLLFNTKVGDFHCGLRGIRKDAYIKLDMQTSGMEYASEMIVKSVIFKFKIAEVPIVLHVDGRDRQPHLRSWRDGWRHLEFLLIYSPRWLFLYPGIALIAGGIIIILACFSKFFSAAELSSGRFVIFGLMAVVTGYQSVIFSFFTKVFAESEGLIPSDPMIRSIFSQSNIRVMLLAGVLMLLLGLILFFILIDRSDYFIWLGNLKEFILDRLALVSALTFITGSQTILASFFLHILTLKKRARK